MTWLKKILGKQDIGPSHINENYTKEEMSRRISTLSEEEQKAYNWLFEGYSEAWTTETMGLEKKDAKILFAGVYKKLGVTGAREIIHYYAPEQIRFP